MGLHIFAFTDPNLALKHFGLNYRNYGPVISDISMPKMNGFEFIKKVKQIKPVVRVSFITAFEIDDIEFSKILPSVVIDEFKQKPVTNSDDISIIKLGPALTFFGAYIFRTITVYVLYAY